MALQCNVWQKKSLISQVMLKASGKVLGELKVGWQKAVGDKHSLSQNCSDSKRDPGANN